MAKIIDNEWMIKTNKKINHLCSGIENTTRDKPQRRGMWPIKYKGEDGRPTCFACDKEVPAHILEHSE